MTLDSDPRPQLAIGSAANGSSESNASNDSRVLALGPNSDSLDSDQGLNRKGSNESKVLAWGGGRL